MGCGQFHTQERDRPVAETKEWAEKYRPRRFEDVLGQAKAVEQISRLVTEGDPRSLVISGPTGTGKTTLAQIYARALLCTQRWASGSPCLVCPACQEFEEDLHPDFEFYGPEKQTVTEVIELVTGVLSLNPMEAQRHVILFDEVRASRRAYSVLLDALKKFTDTGVFIFTLIDAEELPTPLRDRAMEVVLAEAEPNAVLNSLLRICEGEAVAYEDEALELIAGTTDSFRHASRDLQTLASAGKVMVDAVYAQVLGPRFGWLVRYFEALGAGDLDRQLKELDQTLPDAGGRADLILGLINTLKLKFIGPTLVAGARRLSVVSDEDLYRILRIFEDLAQASKVSLLVLWDSVMAFWSQGPARYTRESLRAHAIRFHDLVRAMARDDPFTELIAPRLEAPAAKTPETPSASAAPRKRSRRLTVGPESGAPSAYLSRAQAADLYEAATFALQVRGAAFNTIIRLDWEAAGRTDEALARAASELLHQFQLRLKSWGYDDVGGLHRVALHERGTSGGLFTTVVAHVPTRHQVSARAWLGHPRRAQQWGVKVTADIETPRTWPAAVERQWKLMREAWRGVDPALLADNARALVDVLEVAPNRRRAAGVVACRRYSVSFGLAEAARKKEAASFAPHFSAFATRRWDFLFKGWERAENDIRQSTRAKWAAKMVALERQFGGGGQLEKEAVRREFEKYQRNQIDNNLRRPPPWGRGERV
jgi:DNA polymerase III gamma/tau subunit